jgi:hypothetical protein
MTFQLFDAVKLREAIALTNGGTAPEGTRLSNC